MSKIANLKFMLLLVTGAFVKQSVEQKAEYITEIEGKQYYAQYSLDKSWLAAKEHCESMGMAMASITSRAQADALRRAHSDSFSGSYWTAARDSLKLSQFVWDATNQTVSSSYIELFHWNMGPQTCLTYLSAGLNKTTMIYYPCTMGFGILCENGTMTTPTTTTTTSTTTSTQATETEPPSDNGAIEKTPLYFFLIFLMLALMINQLSIQH